MQVSEAIYSRRYRLQLPSGAQLPSSSTASLPLGRYQIILLGDSDTRACITCSDSLSFHAPSRRRIRHRSVASSPLCVAPSHAILIGSGYNLCHSFIHSLCRRKSKFLMQIKYKATSNLLYHAVQKVASDELAELQKLMQ